MINKLMSQIRRRNAAKLYQGAVSVFRDSIDKLDKAYDVLNSEVISAIGQEEELQNKIEASKSGREVLELELNAILSQRMKIESVLA